MDFREWLEAQTDPESAMALAFFSSFPDVVTTHLDLETPPDEVWKAYEDVSDLISSRRLVPALIKLRRSLQGKPSDRGVFKDVRRLTGHDVKSAQGLMDLIDFESDRKADLERRKPSLDGMTGPMANICLALLEIPGLVRNGAHGSLRTVMSKIESGMHQVPTYRNWIDPILERVRKALENPDHGLMGMSKAAYHLLDVPGTEDMVNQKRALAQSLSAMIERWEGYGDWNDAKEVADLMDSLRGMISASGLPVPALDPSVIRHEQSIPATFKVEEASERDLDLTWPFRIGDFLFDVRHGAGTSPLLQRAMRHGILTWMSPTEFLGLAKMLEDPNRQYLNRMKAETRAFAPLTLAVTRNKDEGFRVMGHDGRHRAVLLEEAGIGAIPVLISLPARQMGSETDLELELWPEEGARSTWKSIPIRSGKLLENPA